MEISYIILFALLACSIVANIILLIREFSHAKVLASNEAKEIFLNEQNLKISADLTESKAKLNEMAIANSLLKERERVLFEKQREWENWSKETVETLKSDFERMSLKIFDEARVKITGENKEQISTLLNPIKGDLQNFSKKVEDLNVKSVEKNAMLESQLNQLKELNVKISQDATNLTNALKGDNKKAGNWGELVLERLLEFCGLQEGVEYEKQASSRNEVGELMRPDIIIKLSGNRCIIIDSKLSLGDYEKYSSAKNKDDEALALKSFENSIDRHIKNLSSKKYEDLKEFSNPDFVMIFIPIEGAFSLIMNECSKLYESAYAKKIIFAGPSTLLATLKMVEFLWRIYKQEKNSQEIADLGAKLYDKFRVFLEKYESIGNRINSLKTDYDESLKSLSTGRGNALNLADNLKNAGVKIKDKIKMDFDNE